METDDINENFLVNLWDAYKFKLIGALIGLLLLSIIYFVARRKYPEVGRLV